MTGIDPRHPTRPRRGPRETAQDSSGPSPLVEIVISGTEGEDWVTETISSRGTSFRLLACRPTDRGRRRLLRLFEVRAGGTEVASLVRHLRARLPARDVAATALGTDRTLLRVSVPMPAGCSAVFDLGDFCIRCPFAGKEEASGTAVWRVLVPRIVDARALLEAASRRGRPRATLVRAGAYRREWGLTGRQERAIRTALELGYFDYPRKASLSTVAGRLGVGRSTALELIRKATTKVAADRFLAEPPVDLPL